MHRNIVVIGASAGGIEALRRLVAPLPADLNAALFVVVHILPQHSSALPAILSRAGALPAVHAQDGAPIEPHRIYVAPPNHHLQLAKDQVRVVFGPRENRARPAIDPLFRTAAQAFRSRVIGIILSGTLDDGCNGLIKIKRSGGIAVVQEPDDATFPDLPQNALRAVNTDYRLPASEMAGLLTRLVGEAIETEDNPMPKPAPGAQFVSITCPDCRRPIFIPSSDNILEFRCITGHSFSPEVMRAEHHKRLEEALWSAASSLKEHAALLRKMSESLGAAERSALLAKEAALKEQHARDVEALVETFSG